VSHESGGRDGSVAPRGSRAATTDDVVSSCDGKGGTPVSSKFWAEFHDDRLPALADDLVRRQVAVIATFNRLTAMATKAATATIPIVFGVGDDPVKMGLVASMNRPGGNATGVSMFTTELDAKRLGLLGEMVPAGKAVGLLINPNNASGENQLREVQSAAGSLGLQLHVGRVSGDTDIDAAFAGIQSQRSDLRRSATPTSLEEIRQYGSPSSGLPN
jgi:ABC-type uncharacterized transport system substrate-binding protein